MREWFKRQWIVLRLWGISLPKDDYLVTLDGDRYRHLDVKASRGYSTICATMLRPGEQLCRVVRYGTSPNEPCLYGVHSNKALEMHESYDPQLAAVIWASRERRSWKILRGPGGRERRIVFRRRNQY